MTQFRTASCAAVVAAVLSLSATAVAQAPRASLTVNPDVLTASQTTTVTYSNPSMAGQKVIIQVDNGMRRDNQTDTIEITLDEHGVGSVVWTVPKWFGANFNAPGVTEVHAPILL